MRPLPAKRRERAIAGVMVLLVISGGGGFAPAASADQAPAKVLEAPKDAEMTAAPVASLQGALVALADTLGVAGAIAPEALAGLSDPAAEMLARLVSDAAACGRVRPGPENRVAPSARLDCASRLRATAQMAGSTLAGTETRAIDVWPLLRFEPGATNDTYVHDYAVLVDLGGNDLYDNNAGGNLVDLLRGPDGSDARHKGPARGCETATVGVLSTCFAGSAVLVDGAGNDTYGVLRAPSEIDSGCTSDHLVRRIATGGAGVGGVGVLVDLAGNDRYLGKTLTQGAGHLGGVGVLHDLAGNDEYLAIRSAQGTGVLGGVGALLDDAGNDRYGFYRPAGGLYELRPPNLQASDAICDDGVRQLQGAGTLGGTGLLSDRQGHDTHIVDLPTLRLFGLVDHDAPSLGAATLGGSAVFNDLGGRDVYLDASGTPVPDRGDGVTTGRRGNSVPSGAGVFHDSGR